MATIGGIRVVTDNTDDWRTKFKSAIEKALVQCGEEGASIASDYAPFDTGRLSGSIIYRLAEDNSYVAVGTNVPYAPYQELGTSTYDGHPFLRPMLSNNNARFREILRRALQEG